MTATLDGLIGEIAERVGIERACWALATPARSYRHRRQARAGRARSRGFAARASVGLVDELVAAAPTVAAGLVEGEACDATACARAIDAVSAGSVAEPVALSGQRAALSEAPVTTTETSLTATEATITVTETAVTTTVCLLAQEGVIAGTDASAALVALGDGERVNAAADRARAGAASIAAAIAATSHYAERRPHPASLTSSERHDILEILCCERFVDLSPRQVFMTLLDENRYYCSVRSMYRLLEDHGLAGERRRGGHQSPATYAVPVIEASRPNVVWCWDITKLRGPAKGVLYYLYTILDIFSRKVVGWTIALRESALIAEDLIRDAIVREGIERDQLTLHADRGGPMIAGGVAELLVGLGVTKSHSRPRVSNDKACASYCTPL